MRVREHDDELYDRLRRYAERQSQLRIMRPRVCGGREVPTGSVLTTRGHLHARMRERTNLFERDL
jgi:hypothetical protein